MKSTFILLLCAFLSAALVSTSFAQEESSVSAADVEPAVADLDAQPNGLQEKLKLAWVDVEENGASMDKLDLIGDLYLETGDAPRAVLVFEKAIEEFGGSEVLFLKMARVMGIVGGPEHAVNALKVGLESFPESEQLTYEIGKAYIGLKKPYAAIANLKKVMELTPGKEQYRYHLADAYRVQGKWAESLKLVDGLIEESTAIMDVYLMKGDLLLAQGSRTEGVRFLEELRKKHPDSERVKQLLVRAYQMYAYAESQSGRLSLAVRSIRSSLEVEPENAESQVALASFLNQLGEFEEAESTFKAVLEDNPNNLDAYLFFGQMLEQLDRSPEAAELYRAGLSKAREGGIESAATAFKKLLRIKP
ncbi:tetratricopeptide repeat protein [Pelagicoccus sp. SDUM812002]|uniref:tetratricopeptide repeat protein n=1 Tax=Pelagicoccus sp. SDUM812002 TaxID=3041266 RepID=UPI00280C4BAB|nr:tetratricopeptide repeat protein [Pelagicoccus sp. SDUM812002]MDQ8187843.1 tetratricopeptide repeat protein [Pelagicoccus sp. SDUM812002]